MVAESINNREVQLERSSAANWISLSVFCYINQMAALLGHLAKSASWISLLHYSLWYIQVAIKVNQSENVFISPPDMYLFQKDWNFQFSHKIMQRNVGLYIFCSNTLSNSHCLNCSNQSMFSHNYFVCILNFKFTSRTNKK